MDSALTFLAVYMLTRTSTLGPGAATASNWPRLGSRTRSLNSGARMIPAIPTMKKAERQLSESEMPPPAIWEPAMTPNALPTGIPSE